MREECDQSIVTGARRDLGVTPGMFAGGKRRCRGVGE